MNEQRTLNRQQTAHAPNEQQTQSEQTQSQAQKKHDYQAAINASLNNAIGREPVALVLAFIASDGTLQVTRASPDLMTQCFLIRALSVSVDEAIRNGIARESTPLASSPNPT